MAFRAIESRVAGIRAPLRVKLQIGFLLVIGVLLVTGVVSLVAIAGIREQTLDLERMDARFHPQSAESILEIFIPVRAGVAAGKTGKR